MSSESDDPRLAAYACRQCGSAILDERSRRCCGEEMDPIEHEAVNEPELRSLLRNVFGVSQTGIDVCVYVMEREGATVDDIAAGLDVHRTTITRQLTHLRKLGVVERRKQSLKEGGEVHRFTPVPPEKARRRLYEGLLSWVTDAVGLLDELDRRKLAAASRRDQEASFSPSVQGDE